MAGLYGIALVTLDAGGLNIYCCPAAIELCKSIVAFVAFGDIRAVGSGIAEALMNLMCGECGHLPSGYFNVANWNIIILYNHLYGPWLP